MESKLISLINSNEEWLMQRILDYASEHGYTKYTSTLKEAWRLSISGLSESISVALKEEHLSVELPVEEVSPSNSVAHFGVVEAERHRKRGISLRMFLSLFKYYRQSYFDLIDLKHDKGRKQEALYKIGRLFDIMEVGLCSSWIAEGQDKVVYDLQVANREITNEKNKYLTIFESSLSPGFFINPEGLVENRNLAASRMTQLGSQSGETYYPAEEILSPENGIGTITKQHIGDVLPWLKIEFNLFLNDVLPEHEFTKKVVKDGETTFYRIKISKMLDVSQKFSGTVLILEDITSLTKALDEVKTLKGLIPICSYCKKMKDDGGYWKRLEDYIESRSEAQFSHSICQDCMNKHFPDLD